MESVSHICIRRAHGRVDAGPEEGVEDGRHDAAVGAMDELDLSGSNSRGADAKMISGLYPLNKYSSYIHNTERY